MMSLYDTDTGLEDLTTAAAAAYGADNSRNRIEFYFLIIIKKPAQPFPLFEITSLNKTYLSQQVTELSHVTKKYV